MLFPGRAAPSQHALRFLAEALERAERPLVVIGGGPFSASPRVEHVRRLRDAARALGSGWAMPVVAEHTSGLLPDPEGRGAGLGAALVAGVFDGPLTPDLVLELGSHPVASAYAAVAERAATRVVVGPEGAHDPLGNARAFIVAEPAALLEDLSAMSPAGGARPATWRTPGPSSAPVARRWGRFAPSSARARPQGSMSLAPSRRSREACPRAPWWPWATAWP